MMNQELIDYIKSQLSAGVIDEEIKRKLVETGWASEDVEQAFRQLKNVPVIEGDENLRIPGDASGTTKYDLGIPSEGSEKSSVPEVKPVQDVGPAISQKSETKNDLFKVVIIVISIGVITSVIWVAAKYISGWIGNKEKTLKTVVVSPESVTASPSSSMVILEPSPFVSQKGRFSLSTPKGWKVDESGSFGTLASMGNPVSDIDGENKFMANINVVSESAAGVTLEEYLSASKEVLNKSFTDYQLINETKVDLNDVPGTLLEAKYNMGVYPLHNLQLMLISNNNAFVITATALDSTWNKYHETFRASLLSFTLK